VVGAKIGQPDDDSRPGGVYRSDVRAHLERLRARIDPVRFDWLIAGALTLGLELELWLGGAAPHEQAVTALLGPLVTGAVAVRRRYPAAACVSAGLVVSAFAAFWGEPPVLSIAIAWFCALYGLAVWSERRRFAVGAAAVTLAQLGASAGPAANQAGLFSVITLAVLLIARRVIWDRERRAQIAERERDLAAREAVVEERARIARELHDLVAHNVSMMVVQAGAERRVLGPASGSTGDVLQTIEGIGRGALAEMRRLLGMLRSDGDDPLAPQPALRDVAKLVAQVRAAGLPVELQIEGEPRALPEGIELSAFRIVQEALTNALKHAGQARARVRIRYAADSLELEITDDGAGAGAARTGSGHGLIGMRERVALYGGHLDASRGAEGGFAVRALLPIR
jgi:signal transduction histidine kinase